MKNIYAAIAILFAIGTSGAVLAQQPGRLDGAIVLSTKSIGFIVGVEWGSGTVTLRNGTIVELRISTLKAGMAGLEAVSAQGNIYNLDIQRPQDIAGTYTSIGAGVTIGGGVGVQRMKNEKGVIIELNETSQGIAAKIAASGLKVELR